jgi:hypothetical protein
VSQSEGFTLFELQTKDGRNLVGFITERKGNGFSGDLSGQLTTIPRSKWPKNSHSTSIMPEGLLDAAIVRLWTCSPT